MLEYQYLMQNDSVEDVGEEAGGLVRVELSLNMILVLRHKEQMNWIQIILEQLTDPHPHLSCYWFQNTHHVTVSANQPDNNKIINQEENYFII